MYNDGRGQITIPLFPRQKDNNNKTYYVGDYGNGNVKIDLRTHTFFVFESKENSSHKTLIIRPKKDQ